MTTLSTPVPATRTPAHPVVTGVLGAIVFAAAMAAGEALDLNADVSGEGDAGTSAAGWLASGGLAAVGLLIAVPLGIRAWNGDLRRLLRTATGLAIAGAVLIVGFWAGWSSIFSAVAVGLALEHRRRIGSFGAGTALVAGLAATTSIAAAYICVTG